MVIFLILALSVDIFFIFQDVKNLKNTIKQCSDKKNVYKYFSFGFFKFIVFFVIVIFISMLLSIIPSLYYWLARDVVLIKALKLPLNFYSLFIRFIIYFFSPIAAILIIILKMKNKKIALSIIFPIIVLCGFISLVLLSFAYDLKYYKKPLTDTKVSELFKPINIPLVKEGMTKEEVLEILGEPVSCHDNTLIFAEASGRGEYQYLSFYMRFEDERVTEIYNKWEYED